MIKTRRRRTKMKILETAGYKKREIDLPDLQEIFRSMLVDGDCWLAIIHHSAGRVLLDLGRHFETWPDDFALATWGVDDQDFAIVAFSKSRLTRNQYAALLKKTGATLNASALDAPVLMICPARLAGAGIALAATVFGDGHCDHVGDLAMKP
jgi:hypothetical protein